MSWDIRYTGIGSLSLEIIEGVREHRAKDYSKAINRNEAKQKRIKQRSEGIIIRN